MQEPKVLSEDELRTKWNQFSHVWLKMEKTSVGVYGTILALLKLDGATSIIEVGCGSGEGIIQCNAVKPKNASLTAVDLSPDMLKYTKERIRDAEIKLVEASAQKLPFADATFDRYYANFCLHLVPDPDAMLREARRVVKQGSYVAFSVWGRKENSLMFSLPPKIIEELKLPQEEVKERTPFHLSDVEQLRLRVLKAGFSSALAWYQFSPLSVMNGNELAEEVARGSPRMIKLLDGLSPEQLSAFKSRLAEEADKLLVNGTPIGLEAGMILARA